MNISRRSFFQRALASGLAGATVLSSTNNAMAGMSQSGKQVGTLIDLTLCNGCPGKNMPNCVAACRQKNQSKVPEVQKPIQPYWPRTNFEDWSDKKNVFNRLTPYNWTYVDKVKVEHQGRSLEIFVPKRCMHCNNPPCAQICPFGAQTKKPDGPVIIDTEMCFGGAKCRDVCPWGVPARQAGVGLYLKMLPKYAGGGVMFKCDLCYDDLKMGKNPACMDACPQKAIIVGDKESLLQEAQKRTQSINGYVYGEKENGGTSTFYVSAVPFEKIHQAMQAQTIDGKPGRSGMPVGVGNVMDGANGVAAAAIIAPVAGMVAAGFAAYRTMTGKEEK